MNILNSIKNLEKTEEKKDEGLKLVIVDTMKYISDFGEMYSDHSTEVLSNHLKIYKKQMALAEKKIEESEGSKIAKETVLKSGDFRNKIKLLNAKEEREDDKPILIAVIDDKPELGKTVFTEEQLNGMSIFEIKARFENWKEWIAAIEKELERREGNEKEDRR